MASRRIRSRRSKHLLSALGRVFGPHKCGDLVAQLESHQRTSTRCRTAAAANMVLDLWQKGYRDPWTAADRPPPVWGELQVARWKHRLAVIEFPKVNAVLIASARKP